MTHDGEAAIIDASIAIPDGESVDLRRRTIEAG